MAASKVEVDDAEDAEQGDCGDEKEEIVPKAGRIKAHASIQGCYPACTIQGCCPDMNRSPNMEIFGWCFAANANGKCNISPNFS